MKSNPFKLRLFALLAAPILACTQLHADDIAANAFAAEKRAQMNASEGRSTPQLHRVSNKQVLAKPGESDVPVRAKLDPAIQTGIRTTFSTPIHPVIQDAGLSPDAGHQEDYHAPQLH